MKRFIKKLGIAAMAMSLAIGGAVFGNATEVRAEECTATFHYTRDDKNYSDYKIKAWSPSDSTGQLGKFKVSGDEGIFEYTFDNEDEQLSFMIQAANNPADVAYEQTTITEGITGSAIDIYVPDMQPYSVGKPADTDSAKADDKEETEESTTKATVADSDSEEVATAAPVQTQQVRENKPSTKSYKVNFGVALLLDIVLFAIVGVICFMKFSKERIPVYKQQ